ncbi:SpoIID/LytB domain-containing protein [Synechococcus sp. R65.1]|jgi:stage II sporulation protein D|uniref:SpoIID/LytB domain-containing protein n=1 Tax=unclassified Synechococcus TaxID=2626047 RepID=UPI0039C18E81
MKARRWLAFLGSLLLGLWGGEVEGAWAVTVRVQLADTTTPLVVGVSLPARLTNGRGEVLADLPPLRGFWARPSRRGVHLHEAVSPVLFIEPPEGGLVAVNGRWYSGKVLLMGYNRVQAINYVHLEDYVASVVEAEMGARFLPEALKAQAVAARTYVLYHRNSRRWFDVFSDTRSQVYRGLSQRSAAALEATRATRGVVLVYGGKFVNAMYSASAGSRTVGVDGIPYLQSLPDFSPYPKFGHGIGMSQWGAQELARRGWSYRQILAYYYPGVRLARLPD